MIEAFFDNETWGIRATSVVRSVGVVLFDGRQVLEQHYFRTDENEQISMGRTKDDSTIEWWGQPEQANANAIIAEAPLITRASAIMLLSDIGARVENVWSKPGMFDLPMLRDAFGQDIWRYWKERDMQTLLGEFDPDRRTKPMFKGTPHVALDDAIQGHEWLCNLRGAIPRLVEEKRSTPGGKIWTCKIGEVSEALLPPGADIPLRNAVKEAYKRMTGVECNFAFTGWGGKLDVYERQVADNG